MQITKAMELVATSKLRRAKERAEGSRPYHEMLLSTIADIASTNEAELSEWSRGNENSKTLYIAIAGDRGLAGGYNSSIFKITEALAKNGNAVVLPIGKKACEYFSRRQWEIFGTGVQSAADLGVGASMRMGASIAEAFASSRIGRVVLVYTKFKSMITQLPLYEELLPLKRGENLPERDTSFDGDSEELLARIIPDYVGGLIFSSVCESIASECAARRSAMNSANKNAEEIIDTLMLKFNRARQAVITQEITEIVSGADAL